MHAKAVSVLFVEMANHAPPAYAGPFILIEVSLVSSNEVNKYTSVGF